MQSRPRAASRREDLFLAASIIIAWLAVMGVAANVWLRPWPEVLSRADFVSYWTAASMVRDGAAPAMFDLEAQRALQSRLDAGLGLTVGQGGLSNFSPYYNLPAMAYLFVPLTVLPMPWGYALWALTSIGMMLAAVALPLRELPRGASLATLLLTFPAVAATLFEGQANAAFALALGLGVMACVSGRRFAAGLLLGLMWMKPQYAALFLVIFVLKRRWREAAGLIASGAALAGVSFAAVGTRGIADYLAVMSKISSYHPPVGFRISPEAMSNWRGVLVNLWPSLSEGTGTSLTLVLGVATVGLLLLVWRGEWNHESSLFPLQMLAVVLASIVVSPHSHFHGTILILPLLAMALSRPSAWTPVGRAGKAMIAAGYLLALVAFPLRTASWLLVPLFLCAMGLVALESERARRLMPEGALGLAE